MKDPGGYAHNPKYHIELLYDSIEALNAEVEEGVDLSFANRNDPGHFDATAEARGTPIAYGESAYPVLLCGYQRKR